MNKPKVKIGKLSGEINQLSSISAHPAPAVTRVLFSKQDNEARIWLQKKAKDSNLKCRVDGVGNIFIRWVGTEPDLPGVATGSHTDAIPNAGKYDGVVGVLGGLEAIRALQRDGYKPRKNIDLIMFSSEEPTRFGIGCLGSRILGGAIDPQKAVCLQDDTGKSLRNWLVESNYSDGNIDDIINATLPENHYESFVELHIEQGPILERESIDIGVVEKIAAPSSFRINLKGVGGHAGAVLMPGRCDAQLAGADISLLVEKEAINSGSPDTVGTTGVFEIKPNAVNSIPCDAYLEVDFRDTNVEARNKALDKIKTESFNICKRRNVEIQWDWINKDMPALCDEKLVNLAVEIANAHKFSNLKMISRAYHDSLFMASICPTVMLFIPCYKGYSHRPDEYSSDSAIEKGVIVLADMLKSLSQ